METPNIDNINFNDKEQLKRIAELFKAVLNKSEKR